MKKTQVCFKCGKRKAMKQFYAHPMMAEGRLGKCKECTKADVRENRLKRRSYYRAYDRRRYRDDPAVRERIARTAEAWRKSHPERANAHTRVWRAIQAGTLKRLPCEACGDNENVHAHHEDYSKPLDITWLCAACHRAHHLGQERAMRGAGNGGAR